MTRTPAVIPAHNDRASPGNFERPTRQCAARLSADDWPSPLFGTCARPAIRRIGRFLFLLARAASVDPPTRVKEKSKRAGDLKKKNRRPRRRRAQYAKSTNPGLLASSQTRASLRREYRPRHAVSMGLGSFSFGMFYSDATRSFKKFFLNSIVCEYVR